MNRKLLLSIFTPYHRILPLDLRVKYRGIIGIVGQTGANGYWDPMTAKICLALQEGEL